VTYIYEQYLTYTTAETFDIPIHRNKKLSIQQTKAVNIGYKIPHRQRQTIYEKFTAELVLLQMYVRIHK